MAGTNNHRICTEKAAAHVPCETRGLGYSVGNLIKLCNVCVVSSMLLTKLTYFKQAMNVS